MFDSCDEPSWYVFTNILKTNQFCRKIHPALWPEQEVYCGFISHTKIFQILKEFQKKKDDKFIALKIPFQKQLKREKSEKMKKKKKKEKNPLQSES